jgi:hypothetical protein
MAEDRLDPALLKLALILVVGAMAPLLDSTMSTSPSTRWAMTCTRRSRPSSG